MTRAPDELHPARGVEDLVLDEVPVPQAAARRLRRKCVALLALSDLLDQTTLAFKRALDLLPLLLERRQVRLVVERDGQQRCPLVQRLAARRDLAVDLADDAEQTPVTRPNLHRQHEDDIVKVLVGKLEELHGRKDSGRDGLVKTRRPPARDGVTVEGPDNGKGRVGAGNQFARRLRPQTKAASPNRRALEPLQ